MELPEAKKQYYNLKELYNLLGQNFIDEKKFGRWTGEEYNYRENYIEPNEAFLILEKVKQQAITEVEQILQTNNPRLNYRMNNEHCLSSITNDNDIIINNTNKHEHKQDLIKYYYYQNLQDQRTEKIYCDSNSGKDKIKTSVFPSSLIRLAKLKENEKSKEEYTNFYKAHCRHREVLKFLKQIIVDGYIKDIAVKDIDNQHLEQICITKTNFETYERYNFDSWTLKRERNNYELRINKEELDEFISDGYKEEYLKLLDRDCWTVKEAILYSLRKISQTNLSNEEVKKYNEYLSLIEGAKDISMLKTHKKNTYQKETWFLQCMIEGSFSGLISDYLTQYINPIEYINWAKTKSTITLPQELLDAVEEREKIINARSKPVENKSNKLEEESINTLTTNNISDLKTHILTREMQKKGGQSKRLQEKNFFLSEFKKRKKESPNKEDKDIIGEIWEINKENNKPLQRLSKNHGLITLEKWYKEESKNI